MISAILMLTGVFFMLVAALGILRLPDLYTRISAATKASTLGIGFSLLSLALHFNVLGVTSRALATIGFVIITAPVGAHLISRSAYRTGVPLWEGTGADEFGRQSAVGEAVESEAGSRPEPARGGEGDNEDVHSV
jgi:multicomponent Na+:H+ antiporter subunit G